MRKGKNLKILFVCYGNTCRSPIAEGLGRYYLKDLAEVESAGLHASFSQAAIESVELLKRYYDIDISNHRPRSVNEVDLSQFDLIIALDEYVASVLKNNYGVNEEKLIYWQIPDPIGGTIYDYENSLNQIEKEILKLREKLSKFNS